MLFVIKKTAIIFSVVLLISTVLLIFNPNKAYASLQSKYGSFAQPTSTGNQSITGVGFQPKAIIFFLNDQTADGSSANAVIGLGMATSSTSRAAISSHTRDNTNNATQRRHDNTKAITLLNDSSVVSDADFVSFNSDGFTINWTTVDSNARVINYLAIGGDSLTNAAVKQFTTPTSIGNQSTTGVGFQPDAIFLMSILTSSAPPATLSISWTNIGFGVSSTSRAALSAQIVHQSGGGPARRRQRTDKIFTGTNQGSIFAEADLVSMDSDGFTLNWTTTDASARHIWALALKGGSYKVGSFNQATSTGSQSVTGLGFTPAGLILSSFNNISSTSEVTNARFSIGAASSSTSRGSIWYGSTNSGNPSVEDQSLDTSKIIKMMTEGTPTTNAAADLTSFDSDGFTLNWSTADSTAREILYFAMGNDNTSPSDPTSLGGHVAGSYTNDSTPTLTFSLSDPDGSDTVKYRIQIDDSSNFASPVVDYTSALASQGSTSFTAGQAAGSGTYTTGSAGQTLTDGSYYWRVKAIDNNSAESSYSTANSGNVAFIADSTSPSTPGTPSTTTPTTDTTPTWSFTASSDSGSGLASTPYTLQWSTDSNFSSGVSSTTSSANSFTHSTALSDGTWYFRIKATDSAGNDSSYSSNGTVVVDATLPINIELDSPGNNTYTSNDRPVFRWKATTDATAGLSKYILEIDNPSTGSSEPSGDFNVDDIPTSGSSDIETSKYIIKFENFNDSDPSNNYISVHTKSSITWRVNENDGKLREGVVSWKVKARDSAGNETTSSNKLFVDNTSSTIELESLNRITSLEAGAFNTTDKTPSLRGKITDELSGANYGQIQEESGPKIASGPKQVEIKIEKKGKLINSLISFHTINIDKIYGCNGLEVTDSSKQNCDKYATFNFSSEEALGLGVYEITVSGKDKAGNTSGSTSIILNITTFDKLVTSKEKELLRKKIQDLTPEEEKKVEEDVEITKPVRPSNVENIRSNTIKLAKNIIGFATEKVVSSVEQVVSGIDDSLHTVGSGIASVQENLNEAKTNIADNIEQNIASIQGGIKDSRGEISEAYDNVIIYSNGVAKIGLIGFKNSAELLVVVGNETEEAKENISKASKEINSNVASSLNSAAESISSSVGSAIVGVGYIFIPEPTKIYDVKVVILSPTSAKISWKTNQDATGKVNYGLDETYPYDIQSGERAKDHEFILKNLKPDTQYSFEVMSQGKNYVYDANRKFRTPKE